ncbi:uncharacterized protein PpBr36_11346 [Pyricularia pennisetigena]|uniref:uncharacterized protein n=1 Tax=Pyricularia pennisetigena TaxID=1578925 RepID=UPI00115478AF|nr:uncharacterized protein PpBr36_11346 [Pyricularia pennisetigena]TLS20465.1 hypothetical protein PpBr36_11346 [Pyricularia pennisetigena]
MGSKKKLKYPVKWKGFPHEDNTWEPQGNISEDLIKSFETTFEGNHAGVQVLDKRKLCGNVEYLIEWKDPPKGERSWEKAKTLSSARVRGYEARGFPLDQSWNFICTKLRGGGANKPQEQVTKANARRC